MGRRRVRRSYVSGGTEIISSRQRYEVYMYALYAKLYGVCVKVVENKSIPLHLHLYRLCNSWYFPPVK